MRKEIIVVSKDECIWKSLVKVVKDTKEPWIFIHKNIAEELKKTADRNYLPLNGSYELRWNGDIEYPKTKLWITEWPKHRGIWYEIQSMCDDTTFRLDVQDPQELLFIKMH